ncbi:hypothetical protein [Magnetovibrio blakemorei]|uniref:Uncharacterized protein n=1 Tax=Magnetovibrio blakemorei TaxID=28181 RepID=A0A1E5Q9N8_9PROT|nr:hypothetical protein [Magnetovibrio blakemorei]OEJ68228.1 hypothetical protein BEN30_06815 [Magnetovibrio blakemorei]
MAILELTLLKGVAVTKCALLGLAKVGLAMGPIGVPMLVVGSIGSLMLMDQAAAKTAQYIIVKNTSC